MTDNQYQKIEATLNHILKNMVTKDDLNKILDARFDAFEKKLDLNRFATKADLLALEKRLDVRRFATKVDLKNVVDKLLVEIVKCAKKEDLKDFASQASVEKLSTKVDRIEGRLRTMETEIKNIGVMHENTIHEFKILGEHNDMLFEKFDRLNKEVKGYP